MPSVRILCIGLLLVAGPAVAARNGALQEARNLDDQGRTLDALRVVEQVLVETPDDAEAELLKGVWLAKLGRAEEAKRVFLGLSRRRPDLPEPYNNLAALYGAAGEYEQAIEVLKQALQTHPSYGVAYDNLTKVYGELAGQAYSRALGENGGGSAKPVDLAWLTEVASPPRLGGGTQVASVNPEVAVLDSVDREAPVEPPSEPAADPAVAAVDQPDDSLEPAPAKSPAAATAPDQAEVSAAVERWAAAWSAQDVDGYLAAYADGFEPPDGASRSTWERVRRDRLARPEFIKVAVAFLGVEHESPTAASIRFVQSYESDTFADSVVKILDMVWEDGAWQILRERVDE